MHCVYILIHPHICILTDEKRALNAQSFHPGLCGWHMAVAIGTVTMGRLLAVDHVIPPHITAALESFREPPLAVKRSAQTAALLYDS